MRKTKRHRLNLFLLVLTHLLLFVYPTVEKAIHTHRHTDIGKGISSPVTFSPAEKHCSVCEFQFVNFVATQPPQTTVCQAGHAVSPSPGPTEPFSSLSPYFLLRAPPVNTPAPFCA